MNHKAMKIQVDIRGDIDPAEAIIYVSRVINAGRTSKGTYRDLYCYCTRFNNDNWKHPIVVVTNDTKSVDSFLVYKE